MEPEAELVRAAQRGDEDARRELGAWISDTLYRYFRMHFSVDLACELAQETFADVWAKLGTFDTQRPEPFRNWVFSCAKLDAKGETRRGAREAAGRAKLHRHWVWSPDVTFGTALDERGQRDLFYRCLERLPPQYRTVLELYLMSEDDHACADALGIAYHTVRRRRQRAVTMLSQLIARELQQRQRRRQHDVSSPSPS